MRRKIITVLIALFTGLIIFSCQNAVWFENFLDDINSNLICKFILYFREDVTDTTPYTTLEVYKGQTIDADKLDQTAKEKALENKPAEHAVFKGWKYYGDIIPQSITAIDDIVISVKPREEQMQFTPVWYYQYLVKHKFQNVDLTSFDEDESLTIVNDGKKDSPVIVNPLEVEGFTAKPFESKSVSAAEKVTVEVEYERNLVQMIFDPAGGNFNGSNLENIITGYFGTEYPLKIISGTYIEPVKNNCDFIKWEPDILDTFPSKDTVFKAKWSGEKFAVSYKAWQGNQTEAKELFCDTTGWPLIFDSANDFEIPEPDMSFVTSNTVNFVGWYTDKECTESSKLNKNANGKYYIPADTQVSDITLFARFESQKIYCSPLNGDDSNCGYSEIKPVKSIEEAKFNLKTSNNSIGTELVVFDTISSQQDIDALSNTFGNSTGYGADENGIVIKAANSFSGNFIAPEGNLLTFNLTKVKFDGGAVWSNGTAYEVKNGSPVISSNIGNMISGCFLCGGSGFNPCTFVVREDCIIQNFENTYSGGSIINSFNLDLDFRGQLNNCKSDDSIIYGYNYFNVTNAVITNCIVKNGTGYAVSDELARFDITNIQIDSIYGSGLKISKSTLINGLKISNCSNLGIDLSGNLSFADNVQTDTSSCVFVQTGGKINLSLSLPDTFAVIVKAAEYNNNQQVLYSLESSLIQVNYKKFISGHSGYVIDSTGKFISASSIDITPTDPSVVEYDLGNLSASFVVKGSGDAVIQFNVNDEGYNKIKSWGEKYIQYTIDGQYGIAPIMGSSGNYQASINFTNKLTSPGTGVQPFNLEPGLHNIVIFADPLDPASVAFKPISIDVLYME
ncbi:MAG: hypothetical protein KBT21_10325 [Treponema sp.]|nr:hypothetical protein [Candidatus Treponema merdequi]